MRLLLIGLALASCAAYADGPAAPDVQTAKDAAPVATSASQAVAVAASTPERKVSCHREKAIGSNVSHNVCREEQTEAERAQGLSDLRNSVDRVLPTHHGS